MGLFGVLNEIANSEEEGKYFSLQSFPVLRLASHLGILPNSSQLPVGSAPFPVALFSLAQSSTLVSSSLLPSTYVSGCPDKLLGGRTRGVLVLACLSSKRVLSESLLNGLIRAAFSTPQCLSG